MSLQNHWSGVELYAGLVEDAREAMEASDILADYERMRALFEEDATQQDESELVAEVIELRFLLSCKESDEYAARELAIWRRDMASKAKELAEAEAKYQRDNA